MSHYEQLGVASDASGVEIKRAYRAKARETHPDLGGDQTEFARVAQAYEVLSDPGRRLLYDTTGKDDRPPIEVEPQNALLQLFRQLLDSEQDVELVATARRVLEMSSEKFKENRASLAEQQKALKAKRGRVKTKKGVANVFHMVIDQQLQHIEAQLLQIAHDMEVQKEALKMLKSYSEEPVQRVITLENVWSAANGPLRTPPSWVKY